MKAITIMSIILSDSTIGARINDSCVSIINELGLTCATLRESIKTMLDTTGVREPTLKRVVIARFSTIKIMGLVIYQV